MERLNPFSKIAFAVLIGAVLYLIIFLILTSLFAPKPAMIGMMDSVMGSSNSAVLNLVSAVIAIFSIFFISLYLFKPQKANETKKPKDELSIIKKALSADEKKAVEEIEKAKEITQDSLRFRLGWSKAKASTILTNLDKMGLVQRERVGKTYKVYLQK